MVESLYDRMEEKEREESEGKSSKKVYALVLVVVVLVSVIGFLLYALYGGMLPTMERVTNPEEAANTLSDLGNDLSGITDDLKDMENVL